MVPAIAATFVLQLMQAAKVNVHALYRLAGVLTAVGVPVAFWTSALAVVGDALGIPVSPPQLAGIGAAVGGFCAVGATMLTADDPREPLHSWPTR